MDFYTCSIILTELLMLAMVLHVVFYRDFTFERKGWFITTFCAIMICAAAEFASIHFGGRGPSYRIPLIIITVIQFTLTPMIPFYFSGALGVRKVDKTATVILALSLIVEIVSVPFGWIFYFDANANYFHGPYYIIYEVFYIAGLIFLIISLYIVGKHFNHKDSATIIMILVVLLAAILPLIISSLHMEFCGIAMSACLCYIYYNDLIQREIKDDLVAQQEMITKIQGHVISAMANLIENRDLETGEHVGRTCTYVKILAEAARDEGVYSDVIDDNFILQMYQLAALHDIGKICVPDHVLKKPGRLTDEEFEEIKKHASEGGGVVRGILQGITAEEHVEFAAKIARYHHEKWNGTGYPEGLSGEDIPLNARIMAIADVYDALTEERCYKAAMPPEKAFAIIEKDAGTHFDPNLASVFLKHKDDIVNAEIMQL